MHGPTPDFWQARFATQQTGWDRGAPSPQLLAWLADGTLVPCRVVVPGCGTGWEVAELAGRGFDVTGLDYTPAAVQATRARCLAQAVNAQTEQADVLQHQPVQPFEAVYEQTCLCALHPDHWTAYAAQLHRWLVPGGRLLALFMQVVCESATQEGRIEGPPYHCDINAMRALFPASQWEWPKPPFARVKHPSLSHELAVVLTRR